MLPLFCLFLISCNTNNVTISSSVLVSSVDKTLKHTYDIGIRNIEEKYYYYWYIDINSGALVIYDEYNKTQLLSIDYGNYMIINYGGGRTYQGVLYDYGDYYILEVGK